MNTEIYVALIASITSLVVALITWHGSRRSTKLIEVFKLEVKLFSEKIESLDEMIESIQKLKDDMQIILDSPSQTYSATSAKQNIMLDREYIFKCYETNLPNLDEKDATNSHNAKNKALVAENMMATFLENKEYVSELNKEQKRTLRSLRNSLTDIQNMLRDSKTTIAFKKTSKHF